MRIADVLRRKGSTVVTIKPTATVRSMVQRLQENGIGALVVSSDGLAVEGIATERDVVRHLHLDGAAVLDAQVADVMTVVLHTCVPEDPIVEVMRTMTEQRVRHVPVVVDGQLLGIVSIGDAVKHRIDELTSERDQLTAYIHG